MKYARSLPVLQCNVKFFYNIVNKKGVNTGRKFIGIESDPDYFKLAEERIGNTGTVQEQSQNTSNPLADALYQD
jgi:hypothetical protein